MEKHLNNGEVENKKRWAHEYLPGLTPGYESSSLGSIHLILNDSSHFGRVRNQTQWILIILRAVIRNWLCHHIMSVKNSHQDYWISTFSKVEQCKCFNSYKIYCFESILLKSKSLLNSEYQEGLVSIVELCKGQRSETHFNQTRSCIDQSDANSGLVNSLQKSEGSFSWHLFYIL